MKDLVISQLIQAVLVIVTTIITVRYTQLGSLGISEKLKGKFKTRLSKITAIILAVVMPALIVLFTSLAVRRIVLTEGPPTRMDVFYIAFYMIVAAFWLGQTAKGLADLVNQHRNKKDRSESDDESLRL
jgi:hypothetical protein